jgi:hypothetical protein
LLEWNNGQEGADFIKERLDRVVANKEWCEAYSNVEVMVGVAICSDHSLIWVFPMGHSDRHKRPCTFRFEVGWEIHKKCSLIIEDMWKGTSYKENPWERLSSHLDGCKKALLRWQQVEIGRPNREFEEQCNNLAIIQGDKNSLNVGHALKLQRELQGRLEQKELRWRQRAKINWLANGDRNSKYFHACANQC